jgi:hypothetical protein
MMRSDEFTDAVSVRSCQSHSTILVEMAGENSDHPVFNPIAASRIALAAGHRAETVRDALEPKRQ